MATKSVSTRRSQSHRSATIQWVAIGVLAVLGVLAAFVLFGADGTGGGGHSGLPSVQSSVVAN